jgi:hypothetical protein
MIRLTALLRRHPALSPEEFRQRWLGAHAELVRSTPGVGERIVRYEQHLRTAAGGWTGSEGFDGITVQWFRSREDFEAMLASPGYRDAVAPDERRLLDLAAGVYLLTDEPRLVIDGSDGPG